MRRYLETLFRFKTLFLIPVILIPIMALLAAYYGPRDYRVDATLWVEPVPFLPTTVSTRTLANAAQAAAMQERLDTESFRRDMMDRTGLTNAILQGKWPVPTQAQSKVQEMGLDRAPGIGAVLRTLGLVLPSDQGAALKSALTIIDDTIRVAAVGNNLVRITYTGQEPLLGKRLIEEAISLFNEKAQVLRTQEAREAIDFYTRQLALQQDALSRSAVALQQYLETHPDPPTGQTRPPIEQRELDNLKRTVAAAQGLYDSTLKTLEQVRVTGEAAVSGLNTTLQVVDSPQEPDIAAFTRRYIATTMVLGLSLGLLAGILPVMLLTWLDNRVRTREDLEQVVSAPVIVQLPIVPNRPGRGKDAARSALAREAIHGGTA